MDQNEILDEFENETHKDLSFFAGSVVEVMAKYLYCSICGSHLKFIHKTHFAQNCTLEEGHCPSCSIRLSSFIHRLQ